MEKHRPTPPTTTPFSLSKKKKKKKENWSTQNEIWLYFFAIVSVSRHLIHLETLHREMSTRQHQRFRFLLFTLLK